ncbi:MAG TPA: IucA/IucC family protein, partial [Paraburkholderia sp.]|nr:IucA/IucC family protein [Paraburkholderia sp.]
MQHTLLAPQEAAAHLTPQVWCAANRMLVRKAIAEYAHERIVEPQRTGDAAGNGYARYELKSDDGARLYTFEARLLALRHWSIRPETIVCTRDGAEQALDALAFILDVKARLGIKEEMLPIYLDEISSTLYGAAYKAVKAGPDTPELLNADFQAIETAMSEGHPGFVANNGRLGFDAGDYRAFAPEAASAIQVIWLAVHKDNAAFHCAEDLDYEQLMNEELGAQTIARYKATVESHGCNFDDYHLMPAHPWQWFNKLSIAFAAYVATNRIICLGYGDDRYLAQQSIRTFFNVSDRSKRYVKTSLSILNMGFMRGLSPYYMSGTPAINDFIKGMVANDPYLQSKGFTILREVASMGFRNRYYEAAVQADTPY